MTEAAEADLADIRTMLAIEASEKVATCFVRSIEATFARLRSFPLSGPTRAHLAPNLRVTFHHYPYVPQVNAVVIVRIAHGSRDVAAIVEHGGFA